MTIALGPILRLQHPTPTEWHLSAIIVGDGSMPPFTVKSPEGSASLKNRVLLKWSGMTLWRFSWTELLGEQPRSAQYSTAGKTYTIALPAKTDSPRIAYCSCNGFSDGKLLKRVEDQNANWKRLLAIHRGKAPDGTRTKPIHLLVMGGDQVYADEMFDTEPLLRSWAEDNESQRAKSAFTGQMQKTVDAFYFNLYCRRWSQPEVAAVLAVIPTLMMWDDHDIFDGYGSYSDLLNECPVHQGLMASAAKHFRAFQLHLADNETPASFVRTGAALAPPSERNYSHLVTTGRIAIAVLDTRSERNNAQVLSSTSWNAMYNRLDQALVRGTSGESSFDHLLVIAAVPVMYPSFGMLEAGLGLLPGRQEIEDDLRDHWTARPHKAERIRLVRRLLSLAQAKRCRVTILSGDVHVAALGVIQSQRSSSDDDSQTINQLVSSGIVHPPPPGVVQFFLNTVGKLEEEIDRDVIGRMLEIPTADQRFLAARNFMTLNPDDQGRIWAEWWVEGESASYTKVIHKCSVPASVPV